MTCNKMSVRLTRMPHDLPAPPAAQPVAKQEDMREKVRGEHAHDHLIRAEFLTAQQAQDQSHGTGCLRFSLRGK